MGKQSRIEELERENVNLKSFNANLRTALDAEHVQSHEHGIRHTFTIETSGKWGSAANLSVCEAIERLCRALESGGLTVHRVSRHLHNENTNDTAVFEYPRRDTLSGCACRCVGSGSNSG